MNEQDLGWFALVVMASLISVAIGYFDVTVAAVFWVLTMLILLVTRPL